MSKIWYKIKLLFKKREVTVLDGSSVAAIAEMQKKIDAYEEHIILLCGMIQKKDTSVKCLLRGTPLDELMGRTWVNVIELIEKEKQDYENTD